MGISAALAGMLTSALLNGRPASRPLAPEQMVEVQSLLIDAGFSQANLSLDLAEFTSVTGEPATLSNLRAFDRQRPPSQELHRRIDQWLSLWYPHQSARQSLRQVENRLGQHDAALTGSLAVSLIHLFGIHQAYVHHWTYRAQAGDSFTDLSIASGLSLATVIRDNPLHGSILWVGQAISWTPPPPTSVGTQTPNPVKHPAVPSAPPVPKPLISTGVLAGLRPVAGLALLDPTPFSLRGLLQAEPVGQSVTLVVEGQWALLHPRILVQAVKQGNQVAVTGYSRNQLGNLPKKGIVQELRWSRQIVGTILQSWPPYVIETPQEAGTAVSTVAAKLHFGVVPVGAWIHPTHKWATTVRKVLLSHQNRLSVVAPPPSPRAYKAFFAALQVSHLTLESLGQIWSGA